MTHRDVDWQRWGRHHNRPLVRCLGPNSSQHNITVHNTLTINSSPSIGLTGVEHSHLYSEPSWPRSHQSTLSLSSLIGRQAAVWRSRPHTMSHMFQEILAFVFSTSGWVLVSSTLPTDYWKVSSLDGTVITTATYWSNLWKTCVTDSTGVSNCKDFPSMLALDGRLRSSVFRTRFLFPLEGTLSIVSNSFFCSSFSSTAHSDVCQNWSFHLLF